MCVLEHCLDRWGINNLQGDGSCKSANEVDKNVKCSRCWRRRLAGRRHVASEFLLLDFGVSTSRRVSKEAKEVLTHRRAACRRWCHLARTGNFGFCFDAKEQRQ